MPTLPQVLRGTNLSSVVVSGPSIPANLQFIQLAWFEYIGAYRVLHTGIPGENRFGRGVTGASIDSTDYIIAASSSVAGGLYGVYAFEPDPNPLIGTGYDWSQYPTVTASHVFGSTPYINLAAERLIGTDDLSGENGVGWIDHAQRLYSTYSEGYGSAYGAFCHASLDWGTETAVADGRFVTDNPSGIKAISGGAVEIPEWYADAYLGGQRIALWVGRNQSIVTAQDLSQGLSLTAIHHTDASSGFGLLLDDCATPGAGSTTFTSVTGGFTVDMVGARVEGSFTGSNWSNGTYYISTYVSTNEVTLSSSPTPGGAGSAGTFWIAKVVSSTPVLKMWPTTSEPTAGVNRMLRPDMDDLVYNAVDDWGLSYYTWTDSVCGCDWIDFVEGGIRYHGIVFVGLSTQFNVGYINGDVVKGGYRHQIGLYNPMSLSPVTEDAPEVAEPDELTYLDLPALDMTPYVIGDPVTITGITSDSGKSHGSTDGCTITAPNHGLAENDGIVIANVGAGEYDNAWRVTVIVDPDTIQIQNTSLPGNWSGVSASSGELRKMNGSVLGINVMGCKFFPSTKRLHIMHQISFGTGPDALQTLVSVFQLNIPGGP